MKTALMGRISQWLCTIDNFHIRPMLIAPYMYVFNFGHPLPKKGKYQPITVYSGQFSFNPNNKLPCVWL